jgi:hypothetical protein
MKGLTIKNEYGFYDGVFLQVGKYRADNSVAIQAWNMEVGPIATLTVCIPGGQLKENEAYLDTNNCPWVLDFMENKGLAKRTGKVGYSGYCTYPVVTLDMEQIKKYEGQRNEW